MSQDPSEQAPVRKRSLKSQRGSGAFQKKQKEDAKKKRAAAAAKIRADRKKIEKKQEELQSREATLEASSLSANQMRGAVMELCKKLNHDPLKNLIEKAGDPNTPVRDRMMLDKYLVDKMVPDVKSVDLQADMKMNIKVEIKRFGETEATNVTDI